MHKILIVDDMPVFLEYLEGAIPWSEHGFELVGMATNGKEALEAAYLLKPDIVITDINMPYMDGLSFIEALKKDMSETQVVFVTGHSEFDYARRAVKLGASDYIVKPFEKEELLVTLLSLQKKGLPTSAAFTTSDDIYLRREHYLRSLIYANKTATDAKLIPELSKFINDKFHYRIVAMAVDFDQDTTIDFDREMAWKSSVGQLIESMVDDGLMSVSFTDYKGRMLVLTCLENQDDQDIEADDFDSIVKTINLRLGIHVLIGIGKTYKGVNQIIKSYEEAVDTVKHLESLKDERVVAFIGELKHDKVLKIAGQALKYIESNYKSHNFNMDAMSKALLVNQTTLRSAFKSHHGETISDYVLKMRMEHAKTLITSGDRGQYLTFSDIADQVGYTDAGYFSKCFKRYFGQSPKAYKRT